VGYFHCRALPGGQPIAPVNCLKLPVAVGDHYGIVSHSSHSHAQVALPKILHCAHGLIDCCLFAEVLRGYLVKTYTVVGLVLHICLWYVSP
jgi:hypothetical protein